MDRRAFLRRLGFGTIAAAAASSVFDIERLLWVPGEKTIFLPPLLENYTFLTSEIVTREALKIFENSLSMFNLVNREYFDRVWPS